VQGHTGAAQPIREICIENGTVRTVEAGLPMEGMPDETVRSHR